MVSFYLLVMFKYTNLRPVMFKNKPAQHFESLIWKHKRSNCNLFPTTDGMDQVGQNNSTDMFVDTFVVEKSAIMWYLVKLWWTLLYRETQKETLKSLDGLPVEWQYVFMPPVAMFFAPFQCWATLGSNNCSWTFAIACDWHFTLHRRIFGQLFSAKLF